MTISKIPISFIYLFDQYLQASSSLIPMLSEEIYQGLTSEDGIWCSSVHLNCFPTLESKYIDTILIEEMEGIKIICTAALHLSKHKIKVRQPLQKIVLSEFFT